MDNISTGENVTIAGYVEEIVYQNPENGYTVLDFAVDNDLITVVGSFPGINPGEELELMGRWTEHPTFGLQFKAESCSRKLPKTAADMLRYLSAGGVKGIGKATAARIVSAFGDETFDVLEHYPDRLCTIRGISMDKALKIRKAFREQFAVREVMVYLEKFGMTPSECLSAYKVFGIAASDRITENPYCLCSELVGISFDRADEIAEKLTSAPDPSLRIRAGIVHILRHNLGNGHTCLPLESVIGPAQTLLSVTEQDVRENIASLIRSKELISDYLGDREFLFLPRIYMTEKKIAEHIRVMASFPPPRRETLDSEIDDIEKESSISFEKKQREAIRIASRDGLLVLTGGPGTGKTTTLNGILALYEKQDLRVLLCAPTGRAAKRMSEVTGKEAKTIHRLLEVMWGENDRQVFQKNSQNLLEADAVIVDELSMVDIQLFFALLDALPMGCRLVMVGDSDQLPPVGAGNVLHDIIGSGVLPVVQLTEVFRQALQSVIVSNAHMIVEGKHPDLTRRDGDFFFIRREKITAAASTLSDLYSNRLPKAYGYDPMTDIQVITPSKKGELGTIALNKQFQALLNPHDPEKRELTQGGRVLREGDKVMQTKNNYDIIYQRGKQDGQGIFNGDIGIISSIDHRARILRIVFDDKTALYPFDSAGELDLAYAVTVHKSQGCEFECVLMPACGIVKQLSYRNLLYTAVTRAKSIFIAVGAREQINAMVDNDKKTRRYSALKYFLCADEASI